MNNFLFRLTLLFCLRYKQNQRKKKNQTKKNKKKKEKRNKRDTKYGGTKKLCSMRIMKKVQQKRQEREAPESNYKSDTRSFFFSYFFLWSSNLACCFSFGC